MPPKNKPLRDRKYLNSFRNSACYACSVRDRTVVAAHIRFGFFGLGIKPDDSLTLPLCVKCHAKEGANELLFWRTVYWGDKPMSTIDAIEWAKSKALLRYHQWKAAQG